MAIGRTNAVSGGGGGVGAVLTVTAPAGVTVSVRKDDKVKTQTSSADGLAVFKGLETGTWTLTITDGVQTSTKTVSVTADYSTVITFLSATINITYPAGSTCTCSDGTTTFTAPDTSGTWVCIVQNTGTWTISCTDGIYSTSDTVTITEDGQSENVSLDYVYWLFNNSQVVPWTAYSQKDGCNIDSDSINFTSTVDYRGAYTTDKVNLTYYDKIVAKGSITRIINKDEFNIPRLMVVNSPVTNQHYEFGVAHTKFTDTGHITVEVDISAVSGPYHVEIWGSCVGEFTEVYLDSE